MTQSDRDRLVALQKAKAEAITQRQAAEELNLSERHVRRMLSKLRGGDEALVHALRGRPSNRKLDSGMEEQAMKILSGEAYRGFGPTLACEYLAGKHSIEASKETVRHWMMKAGIWQAGRQRLGEVHVWRRRRERYGEMVQWDTSEHDWLEGRGEKLYLIKMIDDASSRLFARFVRHDSTEANLWVLEEYVRRFGRPLEFYTDKASIFQTTPKKNHPVREEALPPTQIGRALQELGIGWIAAHSPQAKGRIERGFQTAQDRLVKGMRIAGVNTWEGANGYLDAEYLPQWEAKFTVVPACADDAHRPLGKRHDLEAILCAVESRGVTNDYTIRHHGRIYQVAAPDLRPRLRGARVRVEQRRSGEIAVRFEEKYLRVSVCEPAPKAHPQPKPERIPRGPNAGGKSQWMKGFWKKPAPSLRQAIEISNATS